MAATLNKVMLIGRLGKDPELKYAANGTPICNFTLATDESYRDQQGNKVDAVEWHRVVVFSRQAETVANYLHKGSLCFVEGSLQTRSWQDQQGQTRYMTEVKGMRVQFLDARSGAETAPSGGYQQAPRQGGYQQGGQQGGGQQGGGHQQPQGGPRGGFQQGPPDDEDLGPAFPSEASGMDEVPF
ncbi:MAG: single-stranded DNA-binding protein [Desulfovibrionaceae bacterium]